MGGLHEESCRLRKPPLFSVEAAGCANVNGTRYMQDPGNWSIATGLALSGKTLGAADGVPIPLAASRPKLAPTIPTGRRARADASGATVDAATWAATLTAIANILNSATSRSRFTFQRSREPACRAEGIISAERWTSGCL